MMAPLDRIWLGITYVLKLVYLSPFDNDGANQVAILPSTVPSNHQTPNYPIFKPPGGSIDGPDSNFQCEYPQMEGWSDCSTAENRSCWLKNDNTGEEIGIGTNYEETDKIPFGIHRTYYLNITDVDKYNADGINFADGKFFNLTYPGPWIQGCWGDVRAYTISKELQLS